MKTKWILLLVVALVLALTCCKEDDSNSDTTYTVTFSRNGGTGAVSAMTASSGSNITLPGGNGLSRNGYTFGGWNTLAAGTGTNFNAGDSYMVTGDVTLYAKWVSAGITVSYTVTFDLNGGSGTAPATQTANAGSSITIPLGSGFSRSGYTFGGWNTNAAGTGTNYNVGSSYTVTVKITLYARWVFTVTFDNNDNGEGSAPAPRIISPGSSTTLPPSSRNGYTFGGWNTNAAGTGTAHAENESFTPNANITLYAHWKYTITFDANNDVASGVVSPLRVDIGGSAALPGKGNLSLVYADFTEWNTKPDGTGTAHAAGSSYTPTGEITFYAQWHITTTSPNSLSTAAEKLTWIQAHGKTGAYSVTANANESIDPKIFSGSNVTITLSGGDISLSSNGAMFTVNPGVTLTLTGSITLNGRASNNESLVKVMGGTLNMNGGTITGNGVYNGGNGRGAGVYVGNGGNFTMSGGTISGNAPSYNNDFAPNQGGGVYVDYGGSFTMTGGTIDNNRAISNGGGVYVAGSSGDDYVPGNFVKTGGTITGYATNGYGNVVVSKVGGIPRDNQGHAVYVFRGGNPPALRRETTAGSSDNLSYVNGVASGGWAVSICH